MKGVSFYCMRLCLMAILLMADVALVHSQSSKLTPITGVVFSGEDNEPIVGANVIVQGSNIGCITDMQGQFTINAPAGSKLLKVSFIGMQTKLVAIKHGTMKIVLESDSQQLDEVMVVAYGTAKKGTFTGSASVINTEKIEERPATDITSALSAASSGVSVQSATGMPGSSSTVRIRGVGSFGASSDPLIVLDGIPFDGSISGINPADIENITVLKDASSTALYGSRAANGVLLINTKCGKEGKMKFKVKFNQGYTARQGGDYNRLNTQQYLETYWRMLSNDYAKNGNASPAQEASLNLKTAVGYNPFNVEDSQMVLEDGKLNPQAINMWADDTDWEKAVLQNGKRTDANFSVNGGNKNVTYYGSLGYTDEDGYVVGTKYTRFTSQTKISSQVTKWLKIGLANNFTYTTTEGQQSTSRGSVSNTFRFLRYVPPIVPIHLRDSSTKEPILDESGNPYYDFGNGYKNTDKRIFGSGVSVNPAIELKGNDKGYKRRRNDFRGNVEIKLPLDLKFEANGNFTSIAYSYHSSSSSYPGKDVSDSSTKTNSFTNSYTFNEILSYQKNIQAHTFDIMIGHESHSYEYNNLTATMINEIMGGNSEFSNYTTIDENPMSYTNKYKTEGFFSRINYDYDGKYFLSASLRRDGSSKFSKESRWGNFWSVGASWRIDQESFVKKYSWIDMLKLRLSYGMIGNDDLGSYYPYMSTYSSAQNVDEAGYIVGNFGNNNLKWEVSKNFDLALEFNLFKKVRGSIEYFSRQSSNLLFAVPLSPSSGFDSVNKNAGTMFNRGFEFNLGGDVIKNKNWRFEADFNATYIKNKITELPVDEFIDNYVFKIAEGHSRYDFYLRQWRGVDPQTGNSLYVPDDVEKAQHLVNVNGVDYTTSIEEAKYDYSGCGLPKINGGLTLSLGYKGISLETTLGFQLGGKLYDTAFYQLMYPNYNSSYQNLSTEILKCWKAPGDITDVPRLTCDATDAANLNGEYSTRWLVSSDELDITNITLSYSFSKEFLKNLNLSYAKVYISGNSLHSFVARKGIFPRFNQGGFDLNGDTFAPARAITAGVSISF